ncbi:patatin-like phospholipase family protein [Phyllobacterium sp. LjRoot231]|uniref:hypothetical protein n=1 Tax=Phyllobacterium sp. LjRoot231 TaxID=3342289 RepID=UPI003ECFBFC8
MKTQAPDTGALLDCDIVMAGGVTSGIIYPGAVAMIARRYSFHSIGGTSVGAIAAAVTAAAEYGRRTGRNAGALMKSANFPGVWVIGQVATPVCFISSLRNALPGHCSRWSPRFSVVAGRCERLSRFSV